MTKLFWLSLFFSTALFAQVGDFLPTQKTISKPFSLPIKISLDGKIDYLVGGRDLVLAPGIQIGFDKTYVQYSLPEMASEFSLMPPREESGWMDFKRKRYDYGTGLVALMKSTLRLGLAPYKGASFTMRRLKANKDALTDGKITLPSELEEIRHWSPGDEGSYQTYGGIQIYAGLDLGPVNLLTGTIGWQNQFIVSVQRTEEGMLLSLTEEKLDRKSVYAGMDLVNVTATKFHGRQLHAQFQLSFSNPLHHELYKKALRGKLTELEDQLPAERKSLTWRGHDVSAYWGIPFLIGQTESQGSYEVTEDKQDYFLEVLQSKKSGLLVPTALQQKFVYHNSESIFLMWTTDMKKSTPHKLRKHFFNPAKAVGFSGFDVELDDDTDYGTVIGEVGVVVTRDDVAKFSTLDPLDVSMNLKARCEEFKLKCAKESKLRSIMKRFAAAMAQEWDARKKALGILMVKEPALLYALLKGSRTTKDAYFKFLSDRYQSLEGLTVLVI